ncbi:MAG TPA: hypothetical protein VEA41_18830 [Salinarimonas sp.]|nr:hypothetical protein [Salinarimonas sp.]
MRKLIAFVVLLAVPVALAEPRIVVPPIGPDPMPETRTVPTPPPPQNGYSKTEGRIIALAGAGLMATGVVLAATSGEKASAAVIVPGAGSVNVAASSVNNGKRYGGVALLGVGAALVWYGIKKAK